MTRVLLAGEAVWGEWLTAAGYLVDPAPDGTHALAVIAGVEAVARFRESERGNGRAQTPVVAIAANDDEIDAAIQAGADGCLRTPVAREALLEAAGWYARRGDVPELRVEVPAFIRELAPEFLRRQRMGLFETASALRDGDFAAVQTFAHNLKGCGRSFGFPRLTDTGRVMEQAAKDRDAASLQRQIGELREYLAAVDVV